MPVVGPQALQQPVLAGRDPIPFERMVRTAIAATGRRRLVLPIPYPFVLAAAAVYGAVARRPAIRVEQVRRLREHKSFDYRPAQEDFGFTPRSFEDGVRAEVMMLRRASTP